MRILAFILALLPTTSVSLSCAAPDVAEAYLWVDQAEGRYRAVVGKLRFDVVENLPPDPKTNAPQGMSISATFNGKTLRNGKMDADYETEVQISIGCLSIWCGHLEQNVEMLMFFNIDTKIPTYSVGPCHMAYQIPIAEQIKIVERCAQGGRCQPQEY